VKLMRPVAASSVKNIVATPFTATTTLPGTGAVIVRA